MLAGAPSIVLALFGILIFEHRALGFLSRDATDGVVLGSSFFAAGAMLSLVALPLVVATVREGLQAIPNHVREASYAVGKTKIATIRRVLLPAARPSVITGHMLGIGRMIGDTAIIVAAARRHADAPGRRQRAAARHAARDRQHADELHLRQRPDRRSQPARKAYAAAFVLLLIVLALNVVVDVSAARRGSCDGAETDRARSAA